MRKLNKKNVKDLKGITEDILLQTTTDDNVKFFIEKSFKPVVVTYNEGKAELGLMILKDFAGRSIGLHDGLWKEIEKIQDEGREDVILEAFTSIEEKSHLSKAHFFVKVLRKTVPLDYMQRKMRGI